jgi:hypothetical protein
VRTSTVCRGQTDQSQDQFRTLRRRLHHYGAFKRGAGNGGLTGGSGFHAGAGTISPTKTKITHVAEGFDFLGQNIRKYGGKMLITPFKKNVQAFLTKIRSAVKGNWTAEQKNLIGLLNPMIKG